MKNEQAPKPIFQLSRSNELNILLLCAEIELSLNSRDELRRLLKTDLDWDYLIAISQHHRLLPLLCFNLSQWADDLVPPTLSRRLRELNTQTATLTLAQAAALKRISGLFRQNNIEFLVIKGWGLVNRLYNNIALRQSHDVDILLRKEDIEKATNLLKQLGFTHENVPPNFDFNSRLGQRFLTWNSETSFIDEFRGVYIDIHWKLSHNDNSLPLDYTELWQKESRYIEYDKVDPPSFSDSFHFVFLCYHGAKHQWRRLHWLCDVAFMLRKSQLNWNEIIDYSQKLGILPTIGLALNLCHRLFNCDIPSEMHSHPILQSTTKFALQHENIIANCKEITTQVLFLRAFQNLYWAFKMQTHWRLRVNIAAHLFNPSISDFKLVNLPDSYAGFYRLLRLLRWVVVLPFYAVRNPTFKLLTVLRSK